MYYADWAPNDPKAYGYEMYAFKTTTQINIHIKLFIFFFSFSSCRNLHSGNSLYVHGINLLTLGQDLFFNTSTVSVYSGLQSTSLNLTVGAWGGESIEAFSCGNTIVFAVHVDNSTSVAEFVITAKVAMKTITKV
jgi:hypothetical protein